MCGHGEVLGTLAESRVDSDGGYGCHYRPIDLRPYFVHMPYFLSNDELWVVDLRSSSVGERFSCYCHRLKQREGERAEPLHSHCRT
jgi:hypothetical protein